MINSKKKGSKNERVVAHRLQTWTGYEFSRTPSSGGLHWKGRSDTGGDIVCIDKKHSGRFPFSIEAKVRNDIKFEHLVLDNKNIKIIEFWDQCSDDALEHRKVPLLLMRYDNMPRGMYFIVLALPFYEQIKDELTINYGRLILQKGGWNLVIINSEDLFQTAYEKIYKIARKFLKNG